MERPKVMDYMGPDDTLTGNSGSVENLYAFLNAIGEYIQYLEEKLAINTLQDKN